MGCEVHVSSPALVDQVQAWGSGKEDNHGLLLRELLGTAPRTTFWSSEHNVLSQRPALTVCYTVAGAP